MYSLLFAFGRILFRRKVCGGSLWFVRPYSFAALPPACAWSMSHDEQLPVQPTSLQSVPVSSRDSCTAHLMPSRCMFLLVAISESMKCPLKIIVSDIPTTKNATHSTDTSMTIHRFDMALCDGRGVNSRPELKIPRQIYIFVKYFAKLGPFLLLPSRPYGGLGRMDRIRRRGGGLYVDV